MMQRNLVDTLLKNAAKRAIAATKQREASMVSTNKEYLCLLRVAWTEHTN
jgi:hypothetical protein